MQNQSLLESLFEINGYTSKTITNENDTLIIHLYSIKKPICRQCKLDDFIVHNGSKKRLIKAGRYLFKKIIFSVPQRSLYCRKCDIYWSEKLNFVPERTHYTTLLAKSIPAFTEHLTNKTAALILNLSESTLFRADKEQLEKLEHKIPQVKQIAVDEISRKRRHHYCTIYYDLESKKVLSLMKDRSYKSVEESMSYLSKRIDLDQIESACSDFWKPYVNGVKNYLPNAKQVYDRFHLSRIVSRYVDEERRAYQNGLSDNKRSEIKRHFRWVLLTRKENLSESQEKRLSQLMEINKPLYELYILKEDFLSIFNKNTSRQEAKTAILSWVRTVEKTSFTALKRFANSLYDRMDGILNWFETHISNGVAEGLNNKIQSIKRQAFGYKNFNYFRLKILQKCGHLMSTYQHSMK